jgi:hypothetical protein
MATRSKIGIMSLDNTLKGIYCHYDGYPEHAGKILINHYNSEELANKLMDLGNLSDIKPEIGEKHPFDCHTAGRTPFEYDARWGNHCTAYGRDREEPDSDAKHYSSMEEFERDDMWEEWMYVWHPVDREWKCKCIPRGDGAWTSVKDVLQVRSEQDD